VAASKKERVLEHCDCCDNQHDDNKRHSRRGRTVDATKVVPTNVSNERRTVLHCHSLENGAVWQCSGLPHCCQTHIKVELWICTVKPDHVICPILGVYFHLPTNGVIGWTIICCFYKLRDT
jgi:hypothetical protein